MNEIFKELAQLYQEMEAAYDEIARAADFSCKGCTDNCCDSYFQHHTYIEWAYLWEGIQALSKEKRKEYLRRARAYVVASEQQLAEGKRPQILCPLNDDGLCGLYEHRLMICRLHGVPASMTLPNGSKKQFGGCFRFQEQGESMEGVGEMDRTPYFQRMVALEERLLGWRRNVLPHARQTIADMLIKGAPPLDEE